MSLESYVTGLMKNKNPKGMDKVVLCLLETLESIYLSQVEKKRKKLQSVAISANLPVISVGNITAGGTGKTPCIISLCEMLLEEGKKPAILTRGYRSGFEKVGGIALDGKEILASVKEAGDEPFMMALKLPTVPILVGKDRIANVKKAASLGADVLLLDDGFQYWQLKRNRDIILLDSTNPFGYDHALPRGLLREPLEELRRASLFILTKSDHVTQETLEKIKKRLQEIAPNVPVISSCHSPSKVVSFEKWKERIHDGEDLSGKKAILLSGIGNPKAFETTVSSLGIKVVSSIAFDDHHHYTKEEIERAWQKAKAENAVIVTTEKDGVKLMDLPLDGWPIYIVEIKMTFHEGQDIVKKQWEELL